MNFCPNSDALVWTAAAESSQSDYGDFTLENGGKYIYRVTGSSPTVGIKSVSTFEKYYVWLYDGSHLYHKNVTNSTDYIYWAYYTGSAWKMVYEKTTDPNHESAKVTQLYVEE